VKNGGTPFQHEKFGDFPEKNEKLARFQHQTCCESWLKLLDGENVWKNISFKKPGVAGVG